VLVKDLSPGANSPAPGGLTNVNGMLFFMAYDRPHGYELWKSDGTAAGTALVKDINTGTVNTGAAGSYPGNLTNVNGTLFFTADAGPPQSAGPATATVLGTDVPPANRTNMNGALFFTADGGGGFGRELWKSNGTAAGTVLVKDVMPGLNLGSDPSNLANVNG